MSGWVGFTGSQADRSSRPQKAKASAFPIQTSPGWEVPTKTCGKPGPAFDIVIEFRRPGPNQRFSEERPTATFQRSSRRALWPGAQAAAGPAPGRCGRSMASPYQGLANGGRPAGVSNQAFWLQATSGARAYDSGPSRPSTPNEAATDIPRPAQSSPSFRPEG
jgi:hypothetical protein